MDKGLHAILNRINILSAVLYLSGIICFGFLVSEQFCDRTYFSDNALLPGLVNREFTLGSNAEKLLTSLTLETKGYHGKIPYPWILAQFRQMGLEVYTHNFTLNYPFGKKSKFVGQNVYSIFRASRAPSSEAIVLSAPFRSEDSPHGSTLAGVALMISLAKYFSSKNYWAKDIIFLVADHEMVGIQAWLNAYHDMDPTDVLNHGSLESISGAIQGAVNLEIHSSKMSRLDIKIEGLNGQLPNLDLFNVAVELATRESVTPTFHGMSHPYSGQPFEVWKEYATSVAYMMVSQGTSLATGAHGLFQKFAIQAITLEGIERGSRGSESGYVPVTLLQVGRVVEGIFRSVNNLLEKFNRSYWFYLLPSTRRYISIGYYMIPFGLMTVPLILKALYLYLQFRNPGKSGQKVVANLDLEDDYTSSAFSICFTSHILGLIIASIPLVIQRYGHIIVHYNQQKIPTADLIYFSILTFCLICMFNPLRLIGVRRKGGTMNSRKGAEEDNSINSCYYEARVTAACKFLALLNLCLLFSCLSLINISLSFGLTLIYTPLILISVWCTEKRISCEGKAVQPTDDKSAKHDPQTTRTNRIQGEQMSGGNDDLNSGKFDHHKSSLIPRRVSIFNYLRIKYLINTILLIILHPVFIHFLCLFGMSLVYDSSAGFITHVHRSYEAQKKTILYFIEDWFLYGNWTFILGSVFLFPVWFQFWISQ